MRWLLLKDLQILKRSPLLVALLVVYPVVIALLIGFALSRGPAKPKVAFLNLVPPSANVIDVGGDKLDASKYANELFKSIKPVRVRTRAEALGKVRSGEAIAALIIPADVTEKLASGLQSAHVEVFYNNEDPVKGRFVEQTISARLAEANEALADKFKHIAVQDIKLLQDGGNIDILGRSLSILGLKKTKAILDGTLATLPRGSPSRPALKQVSDFAALAIDNLNISNDVLGTVSRPVIVERKTLRGKRTPLDSFAVAISATISLMFVTILLAAGMLALEREENAFTRLVRGLVTRLGLLVEKIGLAAVCAFGVALAMLMGIGAFVSLDWGRFPLWALALAAGAVAFGALGVAIGALAREVRAASLLAFLLSLPIAFLALVPSGAVSKGLFDVIRVISAAFPFKAALELTNTALNDTGNSMWLPLAHLAVLTLAFTAIGRLALRRFG
ncbi:MAG: type transport system permease protein [Solirubrobacteraceae bacterium]|nr:type transport system permease protein [Solirubrobacteraceae bacterium]